MSEKVPKFTELDIKPIPFEARLTTITNIYHQIEGEQPTATPLVYSEVLQSRLDPYTYRDSVGEQWQELDFGRIKNPHAILIQNRVGANRKVAPSADELEREANKIIVVAIGQEDGGWFIRPGCWFPASPAPNSKVMIKSLSGSCPYKATIYAG